MGNFLISLWEKWLYTIVYEVQEAICILKFSLSSYLIINLRCLSVCVSLTKCLLVLIVIWVILMKVKDEKFFCPDFRPSVLPSVCPSVRPSVGPSVCRLVRNDRVEKWENAHFRPYPQYPPVRNWWPCIRPCLLLYMAMD